MGRLVQGSDLKRHQDQVHLLQDPKRSGLELAAAIAERNSGVVYDSEGLTVGEYLVEWLQSVRGTVRERTWKRREEVVRIHLVPDVGETRLDRLGVLQVQALYRSKLDSGLSARTVRMIHTTLHKAMKQAVGWALVPRNVAEVVDPPRERGTEIRPLNEEQVIDLLRAARGERFEALYVLAVTTGMRSGELFGLRWEDVDLRAGTLQVRRTVFNGRVEAPKTSKGRRGIKLTRTSVAALQERPKINEWVFCTKTGSPVSVHNVHNRSWKPLLRKAGPPAETRFHDLRHTCATLLLTKGVHPKIVQEMLGHSSITITLDLYSHVLPDMQEKAVSAMEDLLE